MDDDDRLREIAYQKWDAAGRPEGRGAEFWQAAKNEYVAYFCSGLYQVDETEFDYIVQGHEGVYSTNDKILPKSKYRMRYNPHYVANGVTIGMYEFLLL